MELNDLMKLAGVRLVEAKYGTAGREIDNDYGHRDSTNTAKQIPYRIRDYDFEGRANYPRMHYSRPGDNPMDEEQAVTECGCENDDPKLDALHMMLNKAGVTDEMITGHQVQLTTSGKTKIMGKLGAMDIDDMLGKLADKLTTSDAEMANDYYSTVEDPAQMESEIDEAPFDFDGDTIDDPATDSPDGQGERFSYESDYNGNVRVSDSQSSKEVYLQGTQGQQLIAKLEAAEPDNQRVQSLLAAYEGQMKAPTQMDDPAMGESLDEADELSEYFDFTATNESNGMSEDHITTTLERPAPGTVDEWSDRPVEVYYERLSPSHEIGEGTSCEIIKVVDAESGQEYQIDEKERQYLQDRVMDEIYNRE